ncbi:MAG: radical SAM protein [Deltaproteobacteria bacterium]|nr:radical SAM protein [Deltaproteobacteria bacterium]
MLIHPKEKMEVGVVMLHAPCNMICTFCVTEESLPTMSFAQAVTVLKNLREKGIGNVVFGGGEPFKWPFDLVALARKAKAMGFLVQVGTNGISLPSGFEFIESIDRYVLPLDAASPAIHNGMRRYRERHHSIILERLETLKRAGKEVTIGTVVTRQNLLHLPDIADFLEGYCRNGGCVHAWHLYRFLPQGRGGEVNASYHSISEEEYDLAIREIRSRLLSFKTYKRKDMYRSKSVGFAQGPFDSPRSENTVKSVVWATNADVACG